MVEDKLCRYLSLTRGYYTLVSEHRYEHLNTFMWHLHWSGPDKRKYAVAKALSGPHVRLHRYIMEETDRKVFIDHENGDSLDCRDDNLRRCNRRQNRWNQRKLNRNNTSGFMGVCLQQNRYWLARCELIGKPVLAKICPTAEDAAWERDLHVLKYCDEFAVFNFPDRISALLLERAQSEHQS